MWVGVLLSVIASVLLNVGQNLTGARPLLSRASAALIVSGTVGNVVAFLFAPGSILQPIEVTQILSQGVYETVTSTSPTPLWWFGLVCAIAGAVVATLYGPQESSGREWVRVTTVSVLSPQEMARAPRIPKRINLAYMTDTSSPQVRALLQETQILRFGNLYYRPIANTQRMEWMRVDPVPLIAAAPEHLWSRFDAPSVKLTATERDSLLIPTLPTNKFPRDTAILTAEGLYMTRTAAMSESEHMRWSQTFWTKNPAWVTYFAVSIVLGAVCKLMYQHTPRMSLYVLYTTLLYGSMIPPHAKMCTRLFKQFDEVDNLLQLKETCRSLGTSWLTYVEVTLVVVASLLWMQVLKELPKLKYEKKKVMPLLQGAFIVLSAVSTGLLNKEFDTVAERPSGTLSWAGYVGGLSLIVAGVGFIARSGGAAQSRMT